MFSNVVANIEPVKERDCENMRRANKHEAILRAISGGTGRQ
uniref:Bm13042 n=1 Tax=Brugia malayi TaxID=6279 RepID=A0A1I9GCZ5_BRUMA|nr:Bm13042 [Brugia malayi]